MLLSKLIPGNQYGFYLPVYKEDEKNARTVKRLVLREFRKLMRTFKTSPNQFVTVSNFQFIQHENFPYECGCEDEVYVRTYGWKCNIQVLEIRK